MTAVERKDAIEYIKGQLEDGYVDVGLHDQNELEIIREAISALICLDQYRWERDVALKQLEELGIGLGQKVDGVYLTKEEHDALAEYENTGLTPNEIKELQGDTLKKLKESNKILRKNNDEYYVAYQKLLDENRKLKSLLKNWLESTT